MPYTFSWLPGGQQLLVISHICRENRCNDLSSLADNLEIFEVPSAVVTHAIQFDSYWDIFCDLNWSPNGRYLSFAYSCGMGDGAGYAEWKVEVFVWDTVVNTILQVTDLTQGLTPADQLDLSRQFRTLYSNLWYDSQTLLVSLLSGPIEIVSGYTDANLIEIATAYYRPGEGLSTLSGDYVSNWARNPVFGEMAFAVEQLVPYINQNNTRRLMAEAGSVQIGTFDGTGLTVSATGPAGCNLEWSPDGRYLVYTNHGSPFVTCADNADMDSVMFLDRTSGQTTQFTLEVNDKYGLLGWVAVVAPDPV